MGFKKILHQYQSLIRSVVVGRRAQKFKLVALGQNLNDGLLAKIFIYFMLSIFAYLYLQPLFYMISTMLMTLPDLLDPTVQWIPRTLNWDNLIKSFEGLKYPTALINSLTISVVGSLLQVFICAITGYALARIKFPGKTLLFLLVFMTFLIPPQIIIIPLYVIYGKLGWLGTPWVFLVPAMLGQGLSSGLFIVIFRQFFSSLPYALEEAAKIDGASIVRLFWKIVLPLAMPACIVVFLFSFIWYWNETYMSSMFLGNNFTPLSIRLNMLEVELYGDMPEIDYMAVDPVTEGTKMAGAFLIVLPPLLLYMIAQRWFIEGVERTGLVD